MEMKQCKVVLHLAPWSTAVGAKGILHKAWVKGRNILVDKRCDANAAYAGSLVGVTLEVDQATLHKPEFCRILLGCRYINKLPKSAEGVLGDYFYDFLYEVDTVIVQGPPAIQNMIPVGESSLHPSPKRHMNEHYMDDSATSSEGQNASASYVGTSISKSYCQSFPVVTEHEYEEESEEEEEGLLIDVIARGNMDKEVGKSVEGNVVAAMPDLGLVSPNSNMVQNLEEKKVQAPITPVIEKEASSMENARQDKCLVLSYVAAVVGESWPVDPVVTELEGDIPLEGNVTNIYTVQSSLSASKGSRGPEEPLKEDLGDGGRRNRADKMGDIMEKAAATSNKRNLECESSFCP
ncbi:unnamed protein product [Alopecurus aequalis]